MNRLTESYKILDSLRLPHGMYVASPSSDYNYVWLRDSFYEVMPYLTHSCDRYEKTYHRILDLFKEYEWKLDAAKKNKPTKAWEYIHARYQAENVTEIDVPWGHVQHDSIGAVLFGIGQGLKEGKTILRDEKDKEIIQKMVDYLFACKYWLDADNGMWEEWREIHSSSIGACIAGLKSIKNFAYVPDELIEKGEIALGNMFPFESADRPVDLSQLSLIYPYDVLKNEEEKKTILQRVEAHLLKSNGVIRYLGDSYYSTLEKTDGRDKPLTHYYGTEAEWTFGLPWLSLCHKHLGNHEKASEYIKRTEKVMLGDGSLPELYYANSNEYNGNTPLGWSNALYILAKSSS